MLVLAAAQNAVLEEVVMIGYLFARWGEAGWGTWRIIVTSAVIRGSYHLYQGFGGFVGNLVMGLLFGWLYPRTKRVMPLVVAHTILDVVAFVGDALHEASPVLALRLQEDCKRAAGRGTDGGRTPPTHVRSSR